MHPPLPLTVPVGRSARLVADLVPSWVPTLKYDVVELVPEVVVGRRLLLDRS